MSDCIFCKITKHETPADIVYEDETVVAFKDIKPSAPVHILVVPKVHIPSVAEVEDSDCEMFAHIFKVARDVAREAGLAGYKLMFNVGPEGGQVVPHIHLHLMGGWGSNKKEIERMPHPRLDK